MAEDRTTGQAIKVLRVLPISPGIALGPVRLLNITSTNQTYAHIEVGQIDSERQRLQAALTAATQELAALHSQVEHTVGSAEAEIFTAQKLMLSDPELLDMVENLLNTQLLAVETAWNQAIEQQSAELAELGDVRLAGRAADVRDVGARVLSHLQTGPVSGVATDDQQTPALIVAYDLTPSQTASLDPASILGICTVEGGPTTHAAIIARALEIPAVAGLDATILANLQTGQELAIDGTHGLIYLQPEGEQRLQLQATMYAAQLRKKTRNLTNWYNQPGQTADGQEVLIYANIGDATGASEAGSKGAQGIGLLRTEFLFGQRAIFPDEQEQFEGYLAVFRAFAQEALFDKTIIARTLDAGADKPFPALEPLLGNWKEANPALGLRGARIHLLHEELLRQQLRALLRASDEANIHLQIMFPMITTIEETRRLKQVLVEVQAELAGKEARIARDIEVGIMIETPAAVWLADALASEVDFFSIGANDLFQYTMAADRTNSRVMGLFGSLEPALWRSINHIVQAAHKQNIPVAVCGEIAADARYGPLLAGLGVMELSVSPPALARVKETLHKHDMLYWQEKAHKLLKAETVVEIEDMLSGL